MGRLKLRVREEGSAILVKVFGGIGLVFFLFSAHHLNS